jgi:hypothetical protein
MAPKLFRALPKEYGRHEELVIRYWLPGIIGSELQTNVNEQPVTWNE